MTAELYEIEFAERNAPRMSHMTDADIRAAINALNATMSAPDYTIATRMVVQGEDKGDLTIYRAELLRRACALYGLPMLTSIQMIALKHVANGREQIPAYHPMFDELCALGLLTSGDEYRLTSVGRVILDNSADDAVNLAAAVRAARPPLDAVAAIISASILSTAGLDAVMQAAE